MKREITLFLTALLCFVSTSMWATTYTVSCTQANGGVQYNGTGYTKGQSFTSDETSFAAIKLEGYAGIVVVSNSTLNVHYLKEGRYFLKNCIASTFTNDEDMYVTSLSVAQGLDFGATNYWSIWDIKANEDGTICFINEGNKYLTAPRHEHSENVKDDGYLHYNPENLTTFYEIGSISDEEVTAGQNKNFTWQPANYLTGTSTDAAYYTFYASPTATSQNYMFLDVNTWDKNFGGSTTYTTKGDHSAKSGDYSTFGRGCVWALEEVTPAVEAAMFKRNVSELQGYVGGPVTLTNVGEIASLNN